MASKAIREILGRNDNITRVARKRAVKMIGMGVHRKDILDVLMNEYKYSESPAIVLYKQAKAEVDRNYREYATKVAETNMKRLNTLIEDAYEGHDRKSILQAIDLLNKMSSVYVDRKEVKTSNEPIEIKFG